MSMLEHSHHDTAFDGAASEEQPMDAPVSLRVTNQSPAFRLPAPADRAVFMPPPPDRGRVHAEDPEVPTEPMPLAPTDNDRARILDSVHKMTGVRYDRLIHRRLRPEGALGAAVILEAVADGTVQSSQGMRALRTCVNQASIPVIAKHIETQANAVQSFRLFESIAQVADTTAIPLLNKYVNAHPSEDDKVKAMRIFQVTKVGVLAAKQAATTNDRQAWNACLQDWTSRTGQSGNALVNPLLVRQWEDTLDPEVEALNNAESYFARGAPSGFSTTRLATKSRLTPHERTVIVGDTYDTLAESNPALAAAAPSEKLREAVTTRETHTSPYSVTVGIEVEVEEHTLKRPELRQQPDQRADRMYRIVEGFRRTKAAGIPYRQDAFWEFAHRPANHYGTLLREEQLLMGADLVNPAYLEHPLHVTIAGITTDGPTGIESSMLARSLEATGWATSAERIRSPAAQAEDTRWLQKTTNGIKDRPAETIEGPADMAVEMRAFTVRGLSGMTRLLRSAQALGSALSAYQSRGRGEELALPRTKLAAIWEQFSAAQATVFEQYGMDSPASVGWNDSANDATNKLVLDANFERMAALLEQAEDSPASAGARFRDIIRGNVIDARAKSMRILDNTRRKDAHDL